VGGSLFTIVVFLFVISVLVFVHELGHFLAARRVGVRVLTFSIGFGPKLLKFTRGDTEYCVSAIPLGGYVKMAGEQPDDDRTGSDDEFLSKNKWERFQILIMGPAMNFIFAIVVMTFVLYQGAQEPVYLDELPIVESVVSGSSAERAGIEIGDQVVSVMGNPVDTWEELLQAVAPHADKEIDIGVRNTRGSRTLNVIPDSETSSSFEMGNLGVSPKMEPQITSVAPGEPASLAGIKVGDVIEALEGKTVSSKELVERINANPGSPLRLGIRRDGASRELTVIPALKGDVGLIGVQINPFEEKTVQPAGLFEAFQLSLIRNWEMTTQIGTALQGLFSGGVSLNQMAGPVGIASMSGSAAQLGWGVLLSFMCMISLNLGLLNLLPIPVLDGGHIAILTLEGIARHDFSMVVKERLMFGGFVALMMLMVTVIYNDLTRVSWIEAFMPWR
tara:strand:- start:29264 stop:30601 length:1338 start_codon:yes stop_codon:yes gene_type:complete